ncbi:hypothetical protein K1719_018364 [Acacia pycnantha]|nr:hypothetical protein K1719_018364 [Acacia pycnantha]
MGYVDALQLYNLPLHGIEKEQSHSHRSRIAWLDGFTRLRHPFLGAHASGGHHIERARRRTRTEEGDGGERSRRKTSTAVSLEQSTVMDIAAPYLPEEIFKNILKRLPVKSLIRFRCVCKYWKNLFKTPSFIAEHHRHSTQQDSVLLFKSGGCLCLINRDMQVLEYQTPRTSLLFPRCDIIGSSNGFLCLVWESSLILWNPATRKILRVPDVLNLDPNGIFIVGFGFSRIVNDYKIVRLAFSRLHGVGVYLVQLFSKSTRSWKELEVGKLEGIMPYDIPGFTLDGAIFLFGSSGGGPESCLISFDIATESLTLIPIPSSAHVTSESRLTTYENKLAMLSKSRVECQSGIESTESFSINLWVMEKCVDTSGERWIWTKIYTSNPFPDPSHPYFLRPLTIWRNEIVGVNEGETVLVLCNLETNEVKMLAMGKHSIGTVIWNHAGSFLLVRDIHVEASSS